MEEEEFELRALSHLSPYLPSISTSQFFSLRLRDLAPWRQSLFEIGFEVLGFGVGSVQSEQQIAEQEQKDVNGVVTSPRRSVAVVDDPGNETIE